MPKKQISSDFFRQINEGKKLGKVISRQSIPIWNFEEIIRQNTVDYVVARNRFNFTNFIIVLKVKLGHLGFLKRRSDNEIISLFLRVFQAFWERSIRAKIWGFD